ncbi:MAG: antitoxin MazE family protein, partial [Serpentinimonas sp.]|nr:antitoxin MazE family protein [Serpentinimonas sp.]
MPQTLNERVQKYREGLRRAGLRPVQIWVPDTRAPGFAPECQRQS